MRVHRHASLYLAALALLIAGVCAPTPADADAIAGCALPLIPEPDLLEERTWEPRALVMFTEKQGVVEFRGEARRPLLVQPVFTLLGSQGRERLAAGEGDVVEIEIGRHPMARASDDVFPHVADALEGHFQGHKIDVLGVQTFDHEEELRFPRREGATALVLEFVNAGGEGAPANSHKLVMFMVPALDGSSK